MRSFRLSILFLFLAALYLVDGRRLFKLPPNLPNAEGPIEHSIAGRQTTSGNRPHKFLNRKTRRMNISLMSALTTMH